MNRVLLLHGGIIPHYRVPVYSYLSMYLRRYGFEVIVTSDGIQKECPHSPLFRYEEMSLSVLSIARLIYRERIDVIIDFLDLRHLYMFPILLIARGLLGCKVIYWGQGRDLLDSHSRIKNLGYATEQALCNALVLYAEHLKKYVPRGFHKKTFIANNTICIDYPGLPAESREMVLNYYGIRTRKNIICVGRIQKRKRLDHLIAAHALMGRADIGLILVGPDPENILRNVAGENVYVIGPVYGERRFDLLSAADVYCLPGAVGLSIVDAFHCGLPFVTENGDESAEIMYLRDGINGFVVPRGHISALAEKLMLLLDDGELRKRFSLEAKRQITEQGSMDKLCAGFMDALGHATGQHTQSLC